MQASTNVENAVSPSQSSVTGHLSETRFDTLPLHGTLLENIARLEGIIAQNNVALNKLAQSAPR